MRILLLSTFIFLFCNVVLSQITVDRSDFGNIGDTIFFERTIFGLDSISPGPSGPSQVWDFSMLQSDSIPDTLFFLDPQGFPQSVGLDPNINLVLQDGPSLQFAEANSNGIYGHALTLDFDTFFTNLLVESTPRLNVYNFPMNYGDVITGTSITNTITLPVKDTLTIPPFTFYVDSVRISPTITKTDSVDAFGQLLLPELRQFDVLRQKSTLNISLALSVLIPNPLPFPPPFVWFPVPPGTVPDIENTSYTYVSKGQNYQVLEITTDSLDQALSVRFQVDTSSNDTIVIALDKPLSSISAYPNPFEDILTIQGLEKESHFELINQLGQIIKTGVLKKENDYIYLKNTKPGFYILSIKSAESKGNTQFRVLKK